MDAAAPLVGDGDGADNDGSSLLLAALSAASSRWGGGSLLSLAPGGFGDRESLRAAAPGARGATAAADMARCGASY
jgi:hypothetical protein